MARAKDTKADARRAIIQIIPAQGWGAEFHYDEKGLSAVTLPLVCWSLVSEKQPLSRRAVWSVIGMIADGEGRIVFADLEKGFSKYERLT